MPEGDLDPKAFVVWLFSFKPALATPTWRLYRQAAGAFLSAIPHVNREAALAALEADVGVGPGGGGVVDRLGRPTMRWRSGSPWPASSGCFAT